MNTALVIRGRVHGGTFVSDEPVPNLEAPADLIVYAEPELRPREGTGRSIFDLFGKAKHLRSAEDIDSQVRDERSWGSE